MICRQCLQDIGPKERFISVPGYIRHTDHMDCLKNLSARIVESEQHLYRAGLFEPTWIERLLEESRNVTED